jgi:ankyrin repeat protein
MPKKSSKKSSKAPVSTALVPHTAPQLAHLLERAKGGKRSDMQQYLSAGGSPNVLVQAEMHGSFCTAPLLCGLVLSKHREAADSIKLLLQAGAAVGATFVDPTQCERTALLVASFQPGGLTILQALLEAGADPCYQTRDTGVSALYLAAIHGCTSTCRALVAASSGRALELECKDNRSTPLMMACVAKSDAVVELLCTLGADVTHTDAYGNTALLTAADVGCSAALLQFLLQQRGVNINQTNINGNTALSSAAAAGRAAAVKVLLEHGADVRLKDKDGQTAVYGAVAAQHLQIVRLLLQHGCDINVTDNDGHTLLIVAAQSGAKLVTELLIQQGASLHAVDERQLTALHHAAHSSGTASTVRLLLAHGAAVNARAFDGMTPLHSAAIVGQLQSAEVLLAAGADVYLRANDGATALHMAAARGYAAVVKLLLEHGAAAVMDSVQGQWCGCCGPVSAVMSCKDVAVLKLLLTAGASVRAVTSRGNSCLHIAARHGHSAAVLCLLIKAGADLHAVNSDGQTAAEVAHTAGHALAEQLLIRAARQ